jgi:hypothetical protein
LVAKASTGTSSKVAVPPPKLDWTAPLVVGKSEEPVKPVIATLPSRPRARVLVRSAPDPPRKVEYSRREPSALSSATKASPNRPPQQSAAPLKVGSKAPRVVGNPSAAKPLTYRWPEPSTAALSISSLPGDPR